MNKQIILSGTLKTNNIKKAEIIISNRVQFNVIKKENELMVDPRLKEINEIILEHKEELVQKQNVVAVRAGYKFKNGQITDEPAVIVLVDRKINLINLNNFDRIPKVFITNL